MRVAERVDRDAAEEIEILAALGIIQAASPPMREDHGRSLVSVHQVARFFGANARGRHASLFRNFLFGHVYRAAPWAAVFAAVWTTGRTRVPGQRAPLAAASKARGDVPPTMRTSETPPASARLAASSLSIIPPETLLQRMRSSISLPRTARRTFWPSRTPATSVRKIRRSARMNSAAAAAMWSALML